MRAEESAAFPGSARPPVAVIGAGSIGIAFAIVFARAGFPVRLQDPAADRRQASLPEIAARLRELADHDLIAAPPSEILARVTVVESVASALEDAVYVQECAPENLELKLLLFQELDLAAGPDAVLASSSSAIPSSRFSAGLPGRHRVLIVHPGNPPYLIPVVEIVPSAYTDADVVDRARNILAAAGLSPVLVSLEVEGFVFNRLQGAVLREAYCLVRDGVVSVADVDRIVRDGLGLRWSVIGPFETADLNTRGGIQSHAAKMGPAYARMGAERGQHDPWTPDLVAEVAAQRRRELPLEQWDERVRWRDRMLMRLVRHRLNSQAESEE